MRAIDDAYRRVACSQTLIPKRRLIAFAVAAAPRRRCRLVLARVRARVRALMQVPRCRFVVVRRRRRYACERPFASRATLI